jgi:hypothetical protein
MRQLRSALRISLPGLIGVFCASWSASALADEPRVIAQVQDTPPRDFVNLRLGASTGTKRLEMCLDVSPIERVAVEACGTGSEILHHEDSPELAHFRVKYALTQWKTEIGWLQPRVGLGFTELQVGADDPGFQFMGVGSRGVETAGPEISLGVRSLYPLGSGFELVGELSLSAAWLQFAPQMVKPQSQFQPAATITFGVGF